MQALGLRERYGHDASYLTALPDAVLRPRDEADLCAALAEAAASRTPVLAVGAQTSTTGASVAVGGGLLIDMQRWPDQHLELQQHSESGATLLAPPGVTLGAITAFAHAHGWELPVDPTSLETCTVAGAVATNASGPSTFRYGAMAAWVSGLRLVDGAGRSLDLRAPQVPKQALGPAALRDPVQWLVGSEGTLGVITGVSLRLQRRPEALAQLFVGFDTEAGLLAAVAELSAARSRMPQLRAVEWLDAACCRLLAPHAGGVRMPEGQGGGLLLVLESPASQPLDLLDAAQRMLDQLAGHGADAATAQLLLTGSERRAFAELRHRVPDTLNRQGRAMAEAAGGGKLSTDWSAPLAALPALLARDSGLFADLGLAGLYRYGHIGDGHPHYNLMCPDAAVRERCQERLASQLAAVVKAGGVPVSEHGIGKIKRGLVAPYLPFGWLAGWRALKAQLDPAGVLGVGNLVS